MPGSSARAAVKARLLRAEGLGQLLHAELAPWRVVGPPGSWGDLSHQVATGERPRGAARGPGGIRDRRDRTGRRYVTRRGPGTGVEQRRQVLRRPRDPRREGPRARLRRGKTLIEVLGCNLCSLERSCFEGSELGIVRLQRQAATTLQPRAARGSRCGGPQRRIIEAFLVWRGKWSVKEKSRACQKPLLFNSLPSPTIVPGYLGDGWLSRTSWLDSGKHEQWQQVPRPPNGWLPS